MSTSNNERVYLAMLQGTLDGEHRTNRTGVDTKALFACRLDLTLSPDTFPLLTTKHVHWHSVMHELLWMLSGSTRTDYLQEHKVTIWDEWARADYRPEMGYPNGELGPVYGKQWRAWPTHDGGHVDQIAKIVDQLRHKRDDRRILLSSWNVGQIDRMKLPPCHYAAQFYVDNNLGLHCSMQIRSWDLFLGGPFNIAQYALLTHMLAHVSGLTPRRLVINSGDTHVYVNHIDAVHEQLRRNVRPGPKLVLDPNVAEIDDFRVEHIRLLDYNPHPSIKAPVAV